MFWKLNHDDQNSAGQFHDSAFEQFMPHLITSEVAESIDCSVLCWLATVSSDGIPNVSPKEAFLHDGQGRVLIANIASPVDGAKH